MSTRRVLNLFFVSTIVWLLPTTTGVVASLINHSDVAAREFVLGTFIVWSFESVVINGAFVQSLWKSTGLAAVHPLLIMFTIAPDFVSLESSIVFGLLVMILTMIFLIKLKNVKTRNGIDSLQLLHAFLNTWVQHKPEELEVYFTKYAVTQPVQTDLFMVNTGDKNLALVIPGVHPGPFSPVGSYNLSELIFRALNSNTTMPVVLHGTGGHERNTPTNKLASEYARTIQKLVESATFSSSGRIKGPICHKAGITNIATLLFGDHAIAILSNSPYVSDDLDPASILDAKNVASELGLELSIIDAHNSIGGPSQRQSNISNNEWRSILNDTVALSENNLTLGFANSNEIQFKHGSDISEGGLSVVVFSTSNSQHVLVAADSNNAVSGLRERLAEAIQKMGLDFVELCTSDTHSLAARSLTDRGYFALGEATDQDEIIRAIETLTDKSKASIASCRLAIKSGTTEIPLIGHDSLNDFATLTSNSIALAKRYSKIIGVAAVVLGIITLLY